VFEGSGFCILPIPIQLCKPLYQLRREDFDVCNERTKLGADIEMPLVHARYELGLHRNDV
jgi:hypothetical protein